MRVSGSELTIGVLGSEDPEKGGVYQYALTVVQALATASGRNDRFVLFATPRYPGADELLRRGWRIERFQPPPEAAGKETPNRFAARLAHWRRVMAAHAARRLGLVPRARTKPELERRLRSLGIDMMIYPIPTPLAVQAGVPYVMAIHDLQHRLTPDSGEVSTPLVWAEREYRYRRGAPRATLVLADSEEGKEDILRFYGRDGVRPDAIRVLPFAPPPYLAAAASTTDEAEVLRKFRLPERFFFYPASTWPSKNHVRLVRALGALRRRGHDVDLVLCGATRGDMRTRTLAELRAVAGEEDVADRVHHLGFVPDEEIGVIYRRALALTMPTLLGPTNIPVVEAWSLDCPVLTSDVRGIRAHAGDAAVLVDPLNPDSIADGLERFLVEPGLRERLVEHGRQRLAAYGFDQFQAGLLVAVDEAKTRIARA